ncbi:TetR/AcrR family transcriptional regulator [Flindersiella endophytica]
MEEQVDRVRSRPGGRSADVRDRVFRAVRDALERGDPGALTIEEVARRSGVHKATIYRRWVSTAGLVADLLVALTPVTTPLPDTGDLCRDLTDVATRVAETVASPMSQAMLPLVAASTEDRLAHAAAGYWASLFEHTATIVRRAQERGQAATDVDPVHAIETLVAPIYLRALITHQPMDTADITALATRTVRMLQPSTVP